MKPILICKTGYTSLTHLLASRGDYEDWICSGMGLSRSDVFVYDAQISDKFPDVNDFAGIIITGSSANIDDRYDWAENLARWIGPIAKENSLPILGICFGHQLLAYSLGGTVEKNPRGREIGTVEITLNREAGTDVLFGGFSSPLPVQFNHEQSVTILPTEAVLLASNSHDCNQAFRFGKRVWGVQFHPEFDLQVVTEAINLRKEKLEQEGINPIAALSRCSETPNGKVLLQKFRSQCGW